MFEAWMAFTRSVMVTPVACSERQVRDNLKLRNLPALYSYRAHAGDAIQRRLQVVVSDLPEARLRNCVGREAVAKYRKRRESEPIGGDVRCRRQFLLRLAERCIHQLQRLHHIHVPVEEQAHFGRAAAGCGANGFEAGHGVHRVLNGAGDRHLHLLHRHHAVIDADHDTRKVSLGKNGDGYLEGEIDACQREQAGEEKDGSRGPGQPEGTLAVAGSFAGHQSFPPPAAGPTCTFVPSSIP